MKYYLIRYDLIDITLWYSDDGITFNYTDKLLAPSTTGSFYSYSLYRACIIKDEGFKIFFSANDSFKTYIGILEGAEIEELKMPAEGLYRTIPGLVCHICSHKWRSVKFISRRFINKFI